MTLSSEDNLLNEIENAACNAFGKLFANGEHFYYCALITTGEALPPVVTAWSYEALARYLLENTYSDEDVGDIKWSYADSPYYNFGSGYFDNVRKLFSFRPEMRYQMSASDWNIEFNLRLQIMEKAMKNLDEKGFFGKGECRKRIVINVEVMPPDYENTLRAMRLNPPDALTQWLVEAAEPVPDR